MFRAKTLFILGAGSSSEVNLPIGEKLKELIAEKIDINFDYREQISGDYQIMHAIQQYARNRAQIGTVYNPHDTSPILNKAWILKNALPQAISIDNLLDAHRGDEEAEVVAKLGIVQSILEAERTSSLFYSGYDEKIDFSSVANTWFAGFMKILTENVAKQDINKIFQNVSFINFNYDRCVEHYLHDALQVYYGLDAATISKILTSLKIIHPYGSVGKLPWQTDDARLPVHYGSEARNILEISQEIKTFNEQLKDSEDLQNLRNSVQEAEIIVFLGFAFHRQNLQLLKPDKPCNAKRIYATAMNISSSDCEIIASEIKDLLNQNEYCAKIEINNKKKCNELFNEYWRSLSSGI